ncbi:SDR family NAD(P)-dependent oxidoreductase [Agromyces sp. ISL-38]|uniref:SDR family NAD(P)-dependent oxidoreductase n=1 Tax=Agromyces sp. ISL-38 TaxID=2819107 RepID=UPI001BE8140A|nr:SDR family NAD(P)-dependent oxidoreductase [Agromyces sp. ISL-38]MBT2498552.1 SDR family NAD(P)-dependent oxidoreductase [Agromyces sp. ISL-38]
MPVGSAIIIGVGPGLGSALARAFAHRGHPVALLGRSQSTLDLYASHLRTTAVPVRGFMADASEPDSLRAGIAAAITDLGAPEVLVYNAAMIRMDTPVDGDDEGWIAALAVDILGAKIAAETILPALNDGRGSLLFTGGGAALYPSADYASISVGKAALRAYVLALKAQLEDAPVHVATVTVSGTIGGGEDRFAPDALAEHYIALHAQERENWETEVIVS